MHIFNIIPRLIKTNLQYKFRSAGSTMKKKDAFDVAEFYKKCIF